jgi:thiol:disulfide interchange protein
MAVGMLGCNRSDAPSGPAKAPPEIAETSVADPEFYSVAHYDPQRDAAADLKSTMERAQSEGKHILLQVGGNWCVWCRRMSDYMAAYAPVRDALNKGFVVMKVNYSEDQPNADFLADYPSIQGYPHLFVLDPQGNLLHSQDTAELEVGEGYGESAFLGFLQQWAPGT